MAVRRFDISEVGKATEYLGVNIEQAARHAVLSVAHKIISRIITVIIPAEPRQPVDRGAYRAAWKAKRTHEGAEVRNTMPYSAIIEHGARAENIKIGRKMIDALTDWVLRKGMVASAGKAPGAKASPARHAAHAVAKVNARVEATKIAWAIAKGMKKKGIFNGGEGLKILDRATDHLEQMYMDALSEELRRQFS